MPTTTDVVAEVTLIVDRTGTGVTIKVEVAVKPPLDAVIVEVPAESVVVRPPASIVATVRLLDDQLMAAAIGLLNWSRAVTVNCFGVPATTEAEAGERLSDAKTGTGVTARFAEAIRPPLMA